MEIQVEQQIKDAAVEVFQKAGLTEEEAVALFYKRTAATGKLTFPVEEERKDENKKVKRRRMNERFAEWDAFSKRSCKYVRKTAFSYSSF